jgi:hypothetical protein
MDQVFLGYDVIVRAWIPSVADLEKIFWEGRNNYFSQRTSDGKAEMGKK